MNLYLVSQDENNDWDTYDSFVVACKTEDEARNFKPLSKDKFGSWAFSLDAIKVQYLGKAAKEIEGVICESFNAG